MLFQDLFVNLLFFIAITSPNRMTDKEDRKSKRSQDTQNTPGTKNVATTKLRMCVWKMNTQWNSKSDFSCVPTRWTPGSRHCASVLQTQVPKLCTDLDLGLLYILISGTYCKFARENNFLAFAFCSPARAMAAGLPRQNHVQKTNDESFRFHMYVSFVGLRLTKTSLTLINRTRLRTKGQSAGYPQAQIGITSNSFQRRAP